MNDDKDDDNGDELLFAVKAAEHSLPEGSNSQVGEILAFVKGMAPILDKDTVTHLKCHRCDHYAPAFFPVEDDYNIVAEQEYCHAKKQTLHHLSLFSIAKCLEYSKKAQKKLTEQAEIMVEEDLRPALADKKLYDRNAFASYDIEYKIKTGSGMICVEFGHKTNGDFVESGIKLCLIRRLDPGFGEQSLKIKEVQDYGKTVMLVMAGRQIRRQMGIDDILKEIAEKRNMDVVYL